MSSASSAERKPLIESAEKKLDAQDPHEMNDKGERVGLVPLLGCKLILDDHEADFVFVFSKFIEDQEGKMQNPEEQARLLFSRRSNADSVATLDCPEIKAFAGKKEMSKFEYQKAVRTVLWRTLQKMGLKLSTFESVDGDETFLKIHLPMDGGLIKRLAQRYRYKMKILEEVYLKERAIIQQIKCVDEDIPQEELIPVNKNGKKVAAFMSYTKDIAHLLEPFNQVDAVRLLRMYLDEWVDIDDLIDQGVCRCAFPAAKYKDVMNLFQVWGNWKLMFRKFPSLQNQDPIRTYLGEKVCLYFYWFCFYTQSLLPLAFFGFLTFCRRIEYFDIPLDTQHYIQMCFAIFVCGWSCFFNINFMRTSSRTIMRWGMDGFEGNEMDRSAYDVRLEGSKSHEIKSALSHVVPGVYCFVYAVGILGLELVSAFLTTMGIDGLSKCKGIILAIVVNGGNFVWGKLAPKLVDVQNHRTQLRWEDALSKSLVLVKLFVAVFPFFNMCFLQQFTNYQCPDEEANETLANLVWDFYENGTAFPVGLPMEEPMKDRNTFNPGGDAFLEGFYFHIQGQKCLQGCLPEFCKGMENCDTDCIMELQHSLLTVFVTFAVTSVVACLLPMLQVQYAMQDEIESARGEKVTGFKMCKILKAIFCRLQKAAAKAAADDMKEAAAANAAANPLAKIPSPLAGIPGSDKLDAMTAVPTVVVDCENYSLLQFQAKQYDIARYGYAAGGGSRVEDFMDLAIGFALITTFSIHLPVMTVVAFFSSIAIYRLTAFRMTCVTCRPQPDGAEGIGIWQDVFDMIAAQASVFNVAIAVLTLSPLRELSIPYKLAAFLIGEHCLLGLRFGIYASVPSSPNDVRSVGNLNTNFVQLLENKMNTAYQVTKDDIEDTAGLQTNEGAAEIQVVWKTPEEGMLGSLAKGLTVGSLGGKQANDVEAGKKK